MSGCGRGANVAIRTWQFGIGFGVVTGVMVRVKDAWEEPGNDSFVRESRAVAPFVGLVTGLIGGVIPPIGIYWLLCRHETKKRRDWT